MKINEEKRKKRLSTTKRVKNYGIMVRTMKRMSDFTQEECDSINLDDYESFGMDIGIIPEHIEEKEEYLKRVARGEQFPPCSPEEIKEGRKTWAKIRKYWILTHPNIKKRQKPL